MTTHCNESFSLLACRHNMSPLGYKSFSFPPTIWNTLSDVRFLKTGRCGVQKSKPVHASAGCRLLYMNWTSKDLHQFQVCDLVKTCNSAIAGSSSVISRSRLCHSLLFTPKTNILHQIDTREHKTLQRSHFSKLWGLDVQCDDSCFFLLVSYPPWADMNMRGKKNSGTKVYIGNTMNILCMSHDRFMFHVWCRLCSPD